MTITNARTFMLFEGHKKRSSSMNIHYKTFLLKSVSIIHIKRLKLSLQLRLFIYDKRDCKPLRPDHSLSNCHISAASLSPPSHPGIQNRRPHPGNNPGAHHVSNHVTRHVIHHVIGRLQNHVAVVVRLRVLRPNRACHRGCGFDDVFCKVMDLCNMKVGNLCM